jgi:predicted NAD/FAD-dependent oxidoreductase
VLVVMLGFAERLAVPFAGAFVNGGPLRWIARNAAKPGRDGGEAWVLHATFDWSTDHADATDAVAVDRLIAAFSRLCRRAGVPELPASVHAEAHFWRQAAPAAPLDARCLWDDDLRIGAGGDWCDGPRLEGAFLSGEALAARILQASRSGPTDDPGPDPAAREGTGG